MFTQHGSYVLHVVTILFLLTSVHSILFFNNNVCSRLGDGRVNLSLLGTYTDGRLLLITDDGSVHEESPSSWNPAAMTLTIRSSSEDLMEKWPLLYQKVNGSLMATMKAALVHFNNQDYIMVELEADEGKKRQFVFQDLKNTEDNLTEYLLKPMDKQAQALSSLSVEQMAISRKSDGSICVYKLDFKSFLIGGLSFRLSHPRCTTDLTLPAHYNQFFVLKSNKKTIYAFSSKDKTIKALVVEEYKTLRPIRTLKVHIESMLSCPMNFLHLMIIFAIILVVFCFVSLVVYLPKNLPEEKLPPLEFPCVEAEILNKYMAPLQPKSTLKVTLATEQPTVQTPSSQEIVVSAASEPPLTSAKSALKPLKAVREVTRSSAPPDSQVNSGVSSVSSARTQSVFSRGSSTGNSSVIASTLTDSSGVALPDGSQGPNRSTPSSPSANRSQAVSGAGNSDSKVLSTSAINSVHSAGGKPISSTSSNLSKTPTSAVLSNASSSGAGSVIL